MTARVAAYALLFTAACGSSAKGESCAKTGDCKGELACLESVCVDEAETKTMKAIEGIRVIIARDPSKCAEIAAQHRKDEWGSDLEISCDERIVRSHGPDGKPGTVDDLF